MVSGNKPSLKTVSIKEDNNKDELDKVLDKPSLDMLKVRFPKKINEIFKISDAKLSELKKDVQNKDYSKVEGIIREELIEDDIDLKEKGENEDKVTQNETIVSLDTITLGIKSEVINTLGSKIASEILKKLKPFNLDKKLEQNIIVGITGKIISSGVLTSFLDGTSTFINKILDGDLNGAFKIGDKAGKFKSIIQSNLNDIILLLEKNKKNPIDKIDKLLSSPKSISEYKQGNDISEIKDVSQKDLTKYLLGLNKEILSYDSKIQDISGMKESVVSTLVKMPVLIQKGVSKLLNFLLGIPFIGDLLAGLLGYNSPKKAIEGFGDELNFAKATNNLSWQGGNFNDLGIKTGNSENPYTVDILKDKNLKDISYKKLTPFYKTCKDEKIDYTKVTFWSSLFNGEKHVKGNEKIIALNKKFKSNPIEDSDFENNKPKDSFYEKLNSLKLKEPAQKTAKKEKTEKELIAERNKLKVSIFKEENLKEKGWTSFAKLGIWDLDDLKTDISLNDLLGDDFKNKIIGQVGSDDYKDIQKYIEDIRTRLIVFKEKQGQAFMPAMFDITGKEIEDIDFGDLLKKELLEILYAKEIKQIKDIDIELGKNKKMKDIKDGLQHLDDLPIDSINIGNNKKITFDITNQRITIGNNNYSIKLNTYGATIGKIEKQGNNIIITPQMLAKDISSKKSTVSIDDFSKSLAMLSINGKMELKDDEGNVVGVVEKN